MSNTSTSSSRSTRYGLSGNSGPPSRPGRGSRGIESSRARKAQSVPRAARANRTTLISHAAATAHVHAGRPALARREGRDRRHVGGPGLRDLVQIVASKSLGKLDRIQNVWLLLFDESHIL
jgi:hypothetical protein